MRVAKHVLSIDYNPITSSDLPYSATELQPQSICYTLRSATIE